MAKQKNDNEKTPAGPPKTEGPEQAAAGAQPEVDAPPKVRRAAAAVERAREQLRKAQEHYEGIRSEATEKIKAVREKSVGELIDDGLKLVRKYPGPGVLLAALLGFLLGRSIRR